MDESFYQIVGNKIVFSDRRMDVHRKPIIEVFHFGSIVQGSYVPPTLDPISIQAALKKSELINKICGKIEDCHHKAEAVGYSLTLIEAEVKAKPTIEQFKDYSNVMSGMITEIKNDVLIYELEAFLFQVKSNLDILMQVLKYVYPYLDENKGFDSEAFEGTKTIKKMRGNGDDMLADYFEHKMGIWISELNEMRKVITHRSKLKGFNTYVYNPESNSISDVVLPNGQKVEKYCKDIFESLLLLYSEVAEKFILPHFQN